MNLPPGDENQALDRNSAPRVPRSQGDTFSYSPELSSCPFREEDSRVQTRRDIGNEVIIDELERAHLRLRAENAQIRTRFEATLITENQESMRMMTREPEDHHSDINDFFQFPRPPTIERIQLEELLLQLLVRWEQFQEEEQPNFISEDSNTSNTDSGEAAESQPNHRRKKQRTKK